MPNRSATFMLNQLKKAEKAMVAQAELAIHQSLLRVGTESTQKVPLKTGALMNSLYISTILRMPSVVMAEIGYTVEYADEQHGYGEWNPWPRKRVRGRTSFFLQNAVAHQASAITYILNSYLNANTLRSRIKAITRVIPIRGDVGGVPLAKTVYYSNGRGNRFYDEGLRKGGKF